MGNKHLEVLVRLFLLAAISFAMAQSQREPNVIGHPEDVRICEGREAVFTCVLDAVVAINNVEWRRYTKSGGTRRMIDLNEEDIRIFTTNTENDTTSSELSIPEVRMADVGSYWVEIQRFTFCNASLTVLPRPSDVALNITKNIKDSSVYLQWDAVDDSLPTTYILTWSRAGGSLQVATLLERTSYTLTGLSLDTGYTIRISATNRCGQGPEIATTVTLSSTPTSSTPIISSTVTTTSTTVTTNAPIPSVATTGTSPVDTTTSTTTTGPHPSVATTSTSSEVTITNTVDTDPTSTASVIGSPDATNIVMTLPSSVIDLTVTASSDSVPTTVISPTSSAASPTMSTPVSVKRYSIITFTSSSTYSIIRSASSGASTTTTTAIAITATTTLSISATTTATASSSSSLTTPDATATSDTSATMSPTPTRDLTETDNKSSDDGFNIADYRYIAAGVLGALIVFFVIIVICCCCCCCCKKRKDKKDVGSLKLDHYTTLSSDGSPSKSIPSVTNAMTMSGEDDAASIKDETDNPEAGLNSLNPPDTYDRLETGKITDPTDVYDKLVPRQPLDPNNTYDKLPPSSTFNQMPSSDTMYDKLPPSNTFHNFSSTSTYDKLPMSNTSNNLPSNNTYDQVPSAPSNTYDRLPSSNTFDKLPSTSTYDKLPSSNTFHSFPANNYDKLPSTMTSHYNKLPSSRTFDKLPTIPAASERLPATGAFTKLPETKIEEVPEANTDDGSHYYDELPCNMKKDVHTGENAYHGEEDPSVHYAVLEPLPKSKSKLRFSDDPTKLYAQIA